MSANSVDHSSLEVLPDISLHLNRARLTDISYICCIYV